MRGNGHGNARAHSKNDNGSLPQRIIRFSLHADGPELGQLFLQPRNATIDAPRFWRLSRLRERVYGQLHRDYQRGE